MKLQAFIDECRRIGVKGMLYLAALTLLPIVGISYWGELSRDVYLASDIPLFQLAAAIGLTSASLIVTGALLFCRHRIRTLRKWLELFAASAVMVGVLSLQLPAALVRYMPHHTLHYMTEYDVSFPGPPRGKSGRCEMGLWVKDRHLQRWIQLCSSRESLHQKRENPQMDRVEIVEEANRYGIRLVSIGFGWSPIGKE